MESRELKGVERGNITNSGNFVQSATPENKAEILVRSLPVVVA